MGDELEEEIMAIEAIYEDALEPLGDRKYKLTIPSNKHVKVTVQFPESYPDSEAPTVDSIECTSPKHSRSLEQNGVNPAALSDVFQSAFIPGQVCLFDFILAVEELFPSIEESEKSEGDIPEDDMSKLSISDTSSEQKGTRNEEQEEEEGEEGGNDNEDDEEYEYDPEAYQKYYQELKSLKAHKQNGKTEHIEDDNGDVLSQWVVSEMISDRKSHFLGLVRQVHSVQDAVRHVQELKEDRKVARAAHVMTAWRIKNDNGTSVQDCDDDGETAAGGRLLHLLSIMDVWNVMVVVCRWFGGVHIGPDRFKHINSCARDAIVKAGLIEESHKGGKHGKK